MVARHLNRTQQSAFKASSVPQLIRSISEELIGAFDNISIQQGMSCDRESLAKAIQERLVVFTQKPVHFLAEWLDPATYTNALRQKQCERNMADLCLREVVAENVELRNELSVSEILTEFAHYKDGAWRNDAHALMSELKKC